MQISLRLARALGCVTGVCALAVAVSGQQPAKAPANAAMPVYTVDPFWPKMPLRNKWLLQGIPTMVTDSKDHIWGLSRPRDIRPDENGAATTPPRADCCIAAPAVFEFDTEGDLLRAWGGPGYTPDWPEQEHAIVVDKEGNVWISASGRGAGIQKFTADGKFLWDFGHRGPRPEAGKTLPPVVENNPPTTKSGFTIARVARWLARSAASDGIRDSSSGSMPSRWTRWATSTQARCGPESACRSST